MEKLSSGINAPQTQTSGMNDLQTQTAKIESKEREMNFFVITSEQSRYGTREVKPSVGWMSRQEIIMLAVSDLIRKGESLESFAGVELIEDESGEMKYSRDLLKEEELAFLYSTDYLASDGCIFDFFSDDALGRASFVESADLYGIGDKARKFLES